MINKLTFVLIFACTLSVYAGDKEDKIKAYYDDEKAYRAIRRAKNDEEARKISQKLQEQMNKKEKAQKQRVKVRKVGKIVYSKISNKQKEFMARHKISPIQKPNNIIRIGQTPPWVRKIGEPCRNRRGGAIRYRRR